jgi:hypothetical protein
MGYMPIRWGSLVAPRPKFAPSFTCDYLQLTSWNRALIEKMIVSQLVKKFPAFYEIRSSITVFTRSRHWTLSRTTWTHPHTHILLLIYLSIILPSMARSLEWSLPFRHSGYIKRYMIFSSLPYLLHAPPMPTSLPCTVFYRCTNNTLTRVHVSVLCADYSRSSCHQE